MGNRGYVVCCRQPTAMALERAIFNVNKYFSIIGVSEQYDEFVETLEYAFPDYFRGIGYLYTALGKTSVVARKA